jgi:hypothetical protein
VTTTDAVWVPGVVKVAVAKRDGTRAKRDRRVDAVVLAGTPFAVHPTLATWPTRYWTVTHTPTGYGAILCAVDEGAARDAAVALSKARVDWANYWPTREAFRALPARTRNRITRIALAATGAQDAREAVDPGRARRDAIEEEA